MQTASFRVWTPVTYLKKARGEIWPKCSEKKQQQKKYQDEDKKSAIKKKINSQIKEAHLKKDSQ